MKKFVLIALAAGLLLTACFTAIPAAGEGSLVRIYALDE